MDNQNQDQRPYTNGPSPEALRALPGVRYLPNPRAADGDGALPRNLEKALGYHGANRWLMAWWEPAGDEAMWSDGLSSATGNWPIYLELIEYLFGRAHAGYELGLGSSDETATNVLLLDLLTREIYLAPLNQATAYLAHWHTRSRAAYRQALAIQPPEISFEELVAALDRAAKEADERIANYDVHPCPQCQYGYVKVGDGSLDRLPCDNPDCQGGAILVKRERPLRIVKQGSLTSFLEDLGEGAEGGKGDAGAADQSSL